MVFPPFYPKEKKMKKYLFFDGNLYEVDDEVEEIINFCNQKHNSEVVKKTYARSKNFIDMKREGVIVESDGLFIPVKNIKIFDTPNALTAITFYFGFQCNLNCCHCHSRLLAKEKNQRMNSDQAKIITQKIISADPISVRLGGGEPLMRPDLVPTIKEISDAGIIISFTTNGWYFNDSLAKQLVDIETFDSIRFSLHGFADSHDSFVRVKGAYNRLLRAQKIAKDYGILHKFVVVVCSQTKNYISDFVDFANRVGSDGIIFRGLKPSGNATSEQFLTPSEWREVDFLISHLSTQSDVAVTFTPSGPPVTNYIGSDEKCLCGRNILTVRPSGDFSACGIAFKTVGNVFKDSIAEVWRKHPDLLQIREGLCPCEAY